MSQNSNEFMSSEEGQENELLLKEVNEEFKKTKIYLKGLVYDLIERLKKKDQKKLSQLVSPMHKKIIRKKNLVVMVLYARALKIAMENMGLDPEIGTDYQNYLAAIRSMQLRFSDEEIIEVIKRVFVFQPGINEADEEIRRSFYEAF